MTFRRLLFSLLAFACIGTAVRAQTSTDPNEGSQLSQDPSTGTYSFSWWGRAGRAYFLQQSDNLLNWTYLPVIESGADQVLQWGFTSNQPRFFLRLESTDQPTSDPYSDDFNGDGLSNWQNLLQGSDPLGPVSFDVNGLSLNWERFYNVPAGTDPNALAPRGDGLTYLQAFQQRLDPNDFYNGSLPDLMLVAGTDQRGDPGTVLPSPITVLVTADPQGQGDGLISAPVAFTVSSGGARLAASADGTGPPPSASVQVRTSSQFVNGVMQNVALAYVYLPATANDVSIITVSATTAGQTASVATTATSDDPTLPPPSGLSVVPISSTAVQLAWTPGDSAHATTVQISLDGGATWRTVNTVAAGVSHATVAGLPAHASALFRLLTAPSGAGTPADPGGDGVTTTLTLPADLATLPSGGGIGSANTDAYAVQTLGAVRVKSESYYTSLAWPLAPYGLVNDSLKDNCYLSRQVTYKETHTVSGYLSYDKSYTATAQITSPVVTGTHTVSPSSAEGSTPTFYATGYNNTIDYRKVLFWDPSEYFSGPFVGEVSITNEAYSAKGSSHIDAVYDGAGNLLVPADDSTGEWTCKVSQPVKFDDLGPLTESQISLGTGPLPGDAFPADQFYGGSFAARAIGHVIQHDYENLFGSIFGLGRFQWQVDSGSNRTVYWDEQFTPFTDVPDPTSWPWSAPVQHDIHTWQSQGATESPIYVVDPRTRRNGQYGRYDVVYLDVALVPDYDHNHVIDDDDRNQTTTDHPFRFWINDDNDSGDTGGDDIPSSGTSGRNCDDYVINGARDLVDFFPVYLDIAPLVQQFPPASYTYYLRQNDAALNFIATDLTADHTGDYLTNVDAANAILHSATDPDTGVSYAAVTGIVADERGTALDAGFVNKITPGSKKGVILLEAKCATTSPLVLTVVAKADTSKAIIALQMPLSISPVEQMFRQRNLRPVAGGSGGAPDRMDSPMNLPDADCNSKTFVFVHGYNVNGDQARGAQSEIFKRMYWSGSHARFVGVSWFGDDSQVSVPVVGPVTPNFQVNIEHAFATAPALAALLNQLGANGDVTLCAHSLGNMLAGSAIQDAKAVVARYYMMDAAVAKEAYDAGEEDLTSGNKIGMENPDWLNYPGQEWCSNWFACFPDEDNRSNLTWKNRFNKVKSRTDCYNFYSSGEDVLSNPLGSPDPVPVSPSQVWNLQERLKGLSAYSSTVLTSAYGGWRIDASLQADMDNGVEFTIGQLKVNPCFDHSYPLPLYGASGSDYLDDGGVMANKLLAEMIPCLSFATGSNPLSSFKDGHNVDMMTLENQWPPERRADKSWRHGDFKAVAYLYVYALYEDYSKLGNLAIKPNP